MSDHEIVTVLKKAAQKYSFETVKARCSECGLESFTTRKPGSNG